MASWTDLEGFLQNDDDNVHARLANFFSGLRQKDYPVQIRLHCKVVGSASEESLFVDELGRSRSLVVEAARDVALIIDELRKAVVERFGPAPTGIFVRVRVAKHGQAAAPDVNMQRKIIAGGDEGDANVAMVRQENDRLRQENAELRRQNVEMAKIVGSTSASMMTLNAEQAKVIGTLGTTRAAAAAADEWSGITTLVGTFALLFLLPQIKKAMGLSESAGIKDVIEQGRKMVLGDAEPSGPPRPPVGAVASVPAKPVETVALPEPKPEIDLKELVSKVKNDESFREKLKAQVMGDPELLSMLM